MSCGQNLQNIEVPARASGFWLFGFRKNIHHGGTESRRELSLLFSSFLHGPASSLVEGILDQCCRLPAFSLFALVFDDGVDFSKNVLLLCVSGGARFVILAGRKNRDSPKHKASIDRWSVEAGEPQLQQIYSLRCKCGFPCAGLLSGVIGLTRGTGRKDGVRPVCPRNSARSAESQSLHG
jgi:hypothetical protein